MMSFLVQDFLDYAQIRSGKFRTNIRPFSVRDMVEKVVSIQKLKAAESGITLRSEVDIAQTEVITDEQRVMQVLLNLQSNALKFTQNGEVSVLASLASEDGTNFLKVQVKDTGIGIPYED
mmetsp:Transcript_8094/g.12463  ORF Transcript_8094/g.12463 Transcript_8094/m.12463 type:complete len:120 (+) Transcript_8094:956-1315(+)